MSENPADDDLTRNRGSWDYTSYGPLDGLSRAYLDTCRCLSRVRHLYKALFDPSEYDYPSEEQLIEDGACPGVVNSVKSLRRYYANGSRSLRMVEREFAGPSTVCLYGIEATSAHAAVRLLSADILARIDRATKNGGPRGHVTPANLAAVRQTLGNRNIGELWGYAMLEREYRAARRRRLASSGPLTRAQLIADLSSGLQWLESHRDEEVSPWYVYDDWWKELALSLSFYPCASEAVQRFEAALARYNQAKAAYNAIRTDAWYRSPPPCAEEQDRLDALTALYAASRDAVSSGDWPARISPEEGAVMEKVIKRCRERYYGRQRLARFGTDAGLDPGDDLRLAHAAVCDCLGSMSALKAEEDMMDCMFDAARAEELGRQLAVFHAAYLRARKHFSAVRQDFVRSSKVVVWGVEADSLHAAVLELAEKTSFAIVDAMEGTGRTWGDDGYYKVPITEENCNSILEACQFFDWPEADRLLKEEYEACRPALAGKEGTIESAENKGDASSIGAGKITVAEANARAMELAKADPEFVNQRARVWAEKIACSLGLVPKLPLWREKQRRRAAAGAKQRRPEVVSLTDATLATVDRDEALERLRKEQEADQEPSPLEPDPPGQPHHVMERKKL